MNERQPNFLLRMAKRTNSAPDVRPRLATRFESQVVELSVADEPSFLAETPPKTRAIRVERERETVQEDSRLPISTADQIELRKMPPAPQDTEPDSLPKRGPEPVGIRETEQEFAAEEKSEIEEPRPLSAPISDEEPPPDVVEKTVLVRTEGPERLRLRKELLTRLVQTEVKLDEPELVPGVPARTRADRRSPTLMPQKPIESSPEGIAPIEITIGHIEVRAVADRPPASKKPMRKQEPATSLGDYLKSREAR